MPRYKRRPRRYRHYDEEEYRFQENTARRRVEAIIAGGEITFQDYDVANQRESFDLVSEPTAAWMKKTIAAQRKRERELRKKQEKEQETRKEKHIDTVQTDLPLKWA